MLLVTPVLPFLPWQVKMSAIRQHEKEFFFCQKFEIFVAVRQSCHAPLLQHTNHTITLKLDKMFTYVSVVAV